MLHRREFLEVMSALGLGSLVGCGSSSDTPESGGRFSPSLLEGSQEEIGGDGDGDEALSVIEGELPSDMLGHVLIAASVPDKAELPLLAGEGVVYRVSFNKTEARIKTRIIRTDDWYVQQKVKGTSDDFNVLFNIARYSPPFGARNLANTALLPVMDGRLLATYDMGRPIELDPRTLNVITPVGKQDNWKASMDGGRLFTMHFVTAHPAFDAAENRVYAINYGLAALAKFLRIVRWDGASEPEFFDVVDEAGKPVVLSMLGHQMNITKDHVVILDGAFDVVGTEPPTMSPVFIIPKNQLVSGQTAVAKRVVIPRECTHFLAAYDDAGGKVNILLMHHNGTNTGGRLEEGDVGFRSGKPIAGQFFRSGTDRNVLGNHVIDVASGKVTSKLLSTDKTWGVGLWGQDPRMGTRLGTAYYQCFGFNPDYLPKRDAERYTDYPFGADFAREVKVSNLPNEIIPPKLLHIDHESMKVLQAFDLDTYRLVSSPTFVPRKNRRSDDDGYLVVTVASDEADQIWIFDATDLEAGPLAKLGHDKLDFPFTLHSTWMESLETPKNSGYRIDRADDYGARLADLPSDKRKLAEAALKIG